MKINVCPAFQLKKKVINGMRLFVKKIRSDFFSLPKRSLHEDSSVAKKSRVTSFCKREIWTESQMFWRSQESVFSCSSSNICTVSAAIRSTFTSCQSQCCEKLRRYSVFGNKLCSLCFIKYKRKKSYLSKKQK